MTEDYCGLFTNLSDDCAIVTPNRRLSAFLSKQYVQSQIELQKQTWPTPVILPINIYLQKLWQTYAIDLTQQPLLLNNFQEIHLWEQTLTTYQDCQQLLQVSETAQHVKTAWHLLKQWCISIDDHRIQETEDGKVLAIWLKTFANLCLDKGYIDTSTMVDVIIKQIADKIILPGNKLIFIGFNEFTPQLLHFISTCRQHNIEVIDWQAHSSQQTNGSRICLHDQETEIITAARWAKALLNENLQANIACVVPNLEQVRDRTAQIFNSVFADKPDAINISAGKKLLNYPIIYSAFQLLNLTRKSIPIELMNYLLATPFLGDSESEQFSRAKYDKRLRQFNQHKLNLQLLLSADSPFALTNACPKLAKRFTAFLNYIEEAFKGRHVYAEWALRITKALSLLGWPGERSLNSEEYQTLEQWRLLLLHFQSIDHVAPSSDFYHAMQQLQRLASKQVFQPKTPEAPVQVLGLLEAAGLPFDHLWLVGVDDISWPSQPLPHPLLPKNLQRLLDMPHATAERELKYCKLLLQQFSKNCQEFICSHAQQRDELMLQASPLIQHFKAMNIQDLKLASYVPAWQQVYVTREMMTLIDAEGPAIKPDEVIHGGTNIIKQQAACPFRAFAECRLHADELELTKPGFNAKERGIILHKTLELLWNELQEQKRLLELRDDELVQLIENSVEKSFLTSQIHYDATSRYVYLEKTRLTKLVNDWLMLEKKRAPFKVSLQEQTIKIDLDKLSLKLRIDRVDELENGKKLIIDYKAGRYNEVSNWFGDRPDEPQLPLYSLLDSSNTIGLSFAQVATGKLTFKGISKESLEVNGIKQYSELKTSELSWEEQLQHWQRIFNQLSDEFCRGVASVDPKEPPQTCQYCSLQAFCRIHENIIEEAEPC